MNTTTKQTVVEVLSSIRLAITHPGIFHGDETSAWAYLKLLGITAPLERRIPTAEELADPTVLVFDIGGQHDVTLRNFDHHQEGGAGARWATECPYASFGLIYDWIQPDDARVAERFEQRIVIPVDAADVNWGTVEGTRPSLSYSAIISGFNPSDGATPSDRDEAFNRATEFSSQVLENEMRAAEVYAAARAVVMAASTAHPESQGSPDRVLVLEKHVPWVGHVFDRPDAAHLLYVMFPSERGGWNLQQVPVTPDSMEGRKPLPLSWKGKRGAELAAIAGLKEGGDATFCHNGRFICGGESREDTDRLAALAVMA